MAFVNASHSVGHKSPDPYTISLSTSLRKAKTISNTITNSLSSNAPSFNVIKLDACPAISGAFIVSSLRKIVEVTRPRISRTGSQKNRSNGTPFTDGGSPHSAALNARIAPAALAQSSSLSFSVLDRSMSIASNKASVVVQAVSSLLNKIHKSSAALAATNCL